MLKTFKLKLLKINNYFLTVILKHNDIKKVLLPQNEPRVTLLKDLFFHGTIYYVGRYIHLIILSANRLIMRIERNAFEKASTLGACAHLHI